jgi:hypothetical protein
VPPSPRSSHRHGSGAAIRLAQNPTTLRTPRDVVDATDQNRFLSIYFWKEAIHTRAGKKKKKNSSACRGLGRVVGPLLAARALPLRCAASTMLSSALLAIYLTRILAVVICGSGSTCVSVLSS